MNGASVAFGAYFLLMMSFCSPYWMVSYPETNSRFKNMGLWQYCFKDYIYPNFQIFHKFTGCHDIFSHVSLSFQFFLSSPQLPILSSLTIIDYVGILCHPWVPVARLANGCSNVCNHGFYYYLRWSVNSGRRRHPFSLERCPAIRMDDVENILSMYSSLM